MYNNCKLNYLKLRVKSTNQGLIEMEGSLTVWISQMMDEESMKKQEQ